MTEKFEAEMRFVGHMPVTDADRERLKKNRALAEQRRREILGR